MLCRTAFLSAIAVFVSIAHLWADTIMPTPTHHYPFDVDASDVTGTNDGTFRNGASIVVDPKRGNVLGLDGVDDYVSLQRSNVPGESTDQSVFTIAAWVRLPEEIVPNAVPLYAENRNGSNDHKNYFGVWQNGLVAFDHWPPTGGTLASVVPVNDGSWHHIAYVQDHPPGLPMRRTLYVDGVLSSQDPFVEAYSGVNPSLWSIGVSLRSDVTPQYLEGSVDDLRFYDVALTAEQIGVLAIPEPSCLCLLSIGGVSLLVLGRRSPRSRGPG